MEIKEHYRVLGNDWWKVPNGQFVLTTDILTVTDISTDKVVFEVSRQNEVIGELYVHHVFINEDFEKIN